VSNEIEARARLFDAIEGGSPFWSRQIIEFGAGAVAEKIDNGGYDRVKYERIISRMRSISAEQLLETIGATGSQFIYPTTDEWPDSLEDLVCPPIALIVRGDVSLLKSSQLAIVGTRNPTHYGVRVAQDFAAGFVDRNWCITSGGAYGIDAAAHKGALIAEGSTIAVLAAGIDINYPAGHARLFAEILESGAIVTEVMPGVNAIPSRFLTRNRLIAALSNATLVVEAAFRSGSLRTARDAAELLRPVMAIPGPINSPTSEGCHRLIGERAAEIVTSVGDAVEFLSI
jgi:DNA protecting protein DprA